MLLHRTFSPGTGATLRSSSTPPVWRIGSPSRPLRTPVRRQGLFKAPRKHACQAAATEYTQAEQTSAAGHDARLVFQDEELYAAPGLLEAWCGPIAVQAIPGACPRHCGAAGAHRQHRRISCAVACVRAVADCCAFATAWPCCVCKPYSCQRVQSVPHVKHARQRSGRAGQTTRTLVTPPVPLEALTPAAAAGAVSRMLCCVHNIQVLGSACSPLRQWSRGSCCLCRSRSQRCRCASARLQQVRARIGAVRAGRVVPASEHTRLRR
jgi:hypothetical protein